MSAALQVTWRELLSRCVKGRIAHLVLSMVAWLTKILPSSNALTVSLIEQHFSKCGW